MFGSKKITLDKVLYERLERVAAQAGYASVQDFVVHALEQQVRHLEEAKAGQHPRKSASPRTM